MNIVSKEGDLRLRSATMGDVEQAMPWYSDAEVLRFSEASNSPYDRNTVERMYKYLMENGEFYIIEALDGNVWTAIGDACIMPDSIPIVIGNPNYRSRGIGKKVLTMLIERARELDWKILRVKGIYHYNERSIRLFKSLGFKETSRKINKKGIEEISYERLL